MTEQPPPNPFQPTQPSSPTETFTAPTTVGAPASTYIAYPPPKKRRRWVPWAAGIGAFILGGAIGNAGDGSTTETPTAADDAAPQPTVTVTAPAAVPPTTAPAVPTYGTPKPKDFRLTIKTLKKECFGSAGCLVSYRIVVAYNGPKLDPATDYEVIYEVRGGEDGPVVNTMKVTGTESSVDSEESVSTKTKAAKLSAVVTDVL